MARKKKPRLTWIRLFLILLLVIIASVSCSLRQTQHSGTNTFTQPPKNEYRAEAFYRENNFLRYREAEHMIGIDVSVHQGIIDWQKVAQAGVEFAILRIGYRGSTIGELHKDEQFEYNLQEAMNAGLRIGVYFFSQAASRAEAVEEAQYVCRILAGREISLPVYFDWEHIEGRASDISNIPLTDCALAFCAEIESQGYQAGVYFNQSLGYDFYRLAQLQDYHLWLAEYNDVPAFRYRFDCLQYTDNARIDGIDVPVDMDLLIFRTK